MKQLCGLILLSFLLAGCEKAIEFDLNETQPSLVIEATIENGAPPIVTLSNSFAFFSNISAALLSNSFVHNAEVTMSNGVKTHRLKEYMVNTAADIPVYYYSIDSASPATAFLGTLNSNYSLQIVVAGKTYTSATSIPPLAKKVDSIWWKKAPDNPDSAKTVLVAKITDPPGYGNYVRYYTRVNRDAFIPGLNSVFDDQIIDGKTYTADVERGVDRNEKIDQDNYSFFNRGDTVTIKFANIDKATYEFWKTMEYSYASIGNPFSSPTKVTGNIKGALGYFGGYAVQYTTIIIPKL